MSCVRGHLLCERRVHQAVVIEEWMDRPEQFDDTGLVST